VEEFSFNLPIAPRFEMGGGENEMLVTPMSSGKGKQSFTFTTIFSAFLLPQIEGSRKQTAAATLVFFCCGIYVA
jgi:hypothetical protein